jgi:hypothetical protein
VVAGLALEVQAKINEGTYSKNDVFSRIAYPIGLRQLTVIEETPAKALSAEKVQQSLFGKIIQSLGLRSKSTTVANVPSTTRPDPSPTGGSDE